MAAPGPPWRERFCGSESKRGEEVPRRYSRATNNDMHPSNRRTHDHRYRTVEDLNHGVGRVESALQRSVPFPQPVSSTVLYCMLELMSLASLGSRISAVEKAGANRCALLHCAHDRRVQACRPPFVATRLSGTVALRARAREEEPPLTYHVHQIIISGYGTGVQWWSCPSGDVEAGHTQW